MTSNRNIFRPIATLFTVSVIALSLIGCSDSGTTQAPDGGFVRPDAFGGIEGGVNPSLPAPPTNSGVLYTAHFNDSELHWFQTDGVTVRAVGKLPLGDGWGSQDMAADPINNLLAVLSDVKRAVQILQVTRPASPATDAVAPQVVATIDYQAGGTIPQFLRFNPYRKRLYVFHSPPLTGTPLTTYNVDAYDTSNPSAPAKLATFVVPITASIALDGPRNILFFVARKTQALHAFDLNNDVHTELPGSPMQLAPLLPEENQVSMQLSELTADPYRNRLYAARRQGPLSELVVVEYPAAVPAAGQSYGQVANFSAAKLIADPFDLAIPTAQRPDLSDAYTPSVDLVTGSIFLTAGVFSGTGAGSVAAMVPITADLQLTQPCQGNDFEQFACFYRTYLDSQASLFLVTDGASCVDYTNKIVVGTSVDPSDETSRASVIMMRYDGNHVLSPVLTAEGRNATAGALVVSAICF